MPPVAAARRPGPSTRAAYSVLVRIELRTGFCDPDAELVDVLDRPGWQRMTFRQRGEVVDEMVRMREERGLWELEAWLRDPGREPRHIIGYWHTAQ